MRTIVATQSRVVALNRGIGISRKGLITAPNGIGWECSWSEVREFWIGAIPIPDFALTELNPEFGPRDHFNEPQTDVIVLRLGRDVHRGYDLVVAKNVEWFRKAAEHFGGVNEAPDTNC